jgi:hypothetical protein
MVVARSTTATEKENRMAKAKWIRVGLLAGVLCTGLGAAHAQSRTLRQQARVTAPQSGVRPGQQIQVADAVWNYFKGLVKEAFDKAISGPNPPQLALAVDEHFFDI